MRHDDWRWRRKPGVVPSLECLKRVSKNGGKASAARYAQVVDGKLVAMGDIAKRIDCTRNHTAAIVRRTPRPLTWAALEAAANAAKKEPK